MEEMSTIHLSTDSSDIPIEGGKLRLYSMRFCPFAQRVHLVLSAKKIPHDIVYINLKTKPEWFLERFPQGKVPAIVIGETQLHESLIVSDFLDEKFTKNPLYPNDPVRKAEDRLVVEAFSKVITNFYKCYFAQTLDVSFINPILDELDNFEKELNKRRKLYFHGDKPGMVDYMIWPWCERLEALKFFGEVFRVPKERFPRLMEWGTNMKQDEAVQKHYLSPEIHFKFMQSNRIGTPDYDLIV